MYLANAFYQMYQSKVEMFKGMGWFIASESLSEALEFSFILFACVCFSHILVYMPGVSVQNFLNAGLLYRIWVLWLFWCFIVVIDSNHILHVNNVKREEAYATLSTITSNIFCTVCMVEERSFCISCKFFYKINILSGNYHNQYNTHSESFSCLRQPAVSSRNYCFWAVCASVHASIHVIYTIPY